MNNSKKQDDFSNNFNPHMFVSCGIEAKVKNKLYFVTGIGYRNTGTRYLVPISTAQQPDGTGQFESVYVHVRQLYFPLAFSYTFGEKFKLKPIIGLTYNINSNVYTKYKSSSTHTVNKNIKGTTVNTLFGFNLCNDELLSKRIGLGLVLSYERTLKDIDNTSSKTIHESIVSASIAIYYTIKPSASN
jgi:hypothetical protein